MDTARRQYTDEFKREAVGLLASSGRPLSQIAQELGIASSRLRARRNRGDGGHAGSPRRSNTQAAIPLLCWQSILLLAHRHAAENAAQSTRADAPPGGSRGIPRGGVSISQICVQALTLVACVN
jgi:transposase-like protein